MSLPPEAVRRTLWMQRRGWPADDPVYADVARAEKALHELYVRLIYLAAPAGTAGRPAQEETRARHD